MAKRNRPLSVHEQINRTLKEIYKDKITGYFNATPDQLLYWHPMTEEERMKEAMREFIEAIKKYKNKHRTKS